MADEPRNARISDSPADFELYATESGGFRGDCLPDDRVPSTNDPAFREGDSI